MVTRFIVVIILQYIQVLNHCTPETNRVLYVNYTSIENEIRLQKYWEIAGTSKALMLKSKLYLSS